MIVLQIADSSKENSIGTHTHLVGGLRVRIAYLINGMSATDGFLVFKLVTKLLGYRVEHSHTLFHNLGSNSITRQNRNLQFHSSLFCSFSNKFNILKVALMAASVWSASRPRVRSILPLSFQVMTVCTKASVRPPGGMLT